MATRLIRQWQGFWLAVLVVAGLVSCTTTPPGTSGGPLTVVATENFWGSIVQQLGGDKIQVTSLVVNPNADPHDYEPTTQDARLIASAAYVVVNGAGYDPWADKLLAANPVSGRVVLNVGDLVGKHPGDNPHLWYSPAYVAQAIKQITADLQKLSPEHQAYFNQKQQQFLSLGLQAYHSIISQIKSHHLGAPVGSTESIFVYMAQALGLDLITPPKFMDDVAEGTEPTTADQLTFEQQIRQRQIRVLLFNSQNVTPEVQALRKLALSNSIPVVPITETLSPVTDNFQTWQTRQLQALETALDHAPAP